MWPQAPLAQRRIHPGLHFASEFLGVEKTGTIFEWLPTRWQNRLSNADDLLGAYIFDIWAGARNPRKVIFRREDETSRLKAYFVDNSELFGGQDWLFTSRPAAVQNYSLRLCAADWDETAVMSWVSKIRIKTPSVLRELPRLVPPCWRGGDVHSLAETLSTRVKSLKCMTADELQRSGREQLLRFEREDLWRERSRRSSQIKLQTGLPVVN